MGTDISLANEFTLPLTYGRDEVVSAQRLRFRNSARLRVLAALSLAALIFLAVQQIDPGLVNASRTMSWQSVALLAAAFVLLPVLFYVFVPALDYRSNPAWRQSYVLTINKNRLRLAREGADSGFELAWPAVNKVLENDLVFLLFFGPKNTTVMIPKRTFRSPEQAAAFRRLVVRK